MTRYLDDGDIPIDSNAAENAMRSRAVGRKNYLFIGPQPPGERAAVILTMIESAKLDGHDPWACLKNVFERLPTLKNAELHLLPHLWTAPPAATAPNAASPALA